MCQTRFWLWQTSFSLLELLPTLSVLYFAVTFFFTNFEEVTKHGLGFGLGSRKIRRKEKKTSTRNGSTGCSNELDSFGFQRTAALVDSRCEVKRTARRTRTELRPRSGQPRTRLWKDPFFIFLFSKRKALASILKPFLIQPSSSSETRMLSMLKKSSRNGLGANVTNMFDTCFLTSTTHWKLSPKASGEVQVTSWHKDHDVNDVKDLVTSISQVMWKPELEIYVRMGIR